MRGTGARWFLWLMVLMFLLQGAVYAVRPMVSYRAIAVGAGALELGVITSAFAVLSLVVAVPIGRWIDRWGEAGFIVVGTLLIGAAGFGLVWIDTIPGLIVSQAVLGLGHIAAVAATQTLVANGSTARQRDGRYGVMTVMVSLGQLVGPAAAGLVASGGSAETQIATGPVFAVGGALGLAACLLGLVVLLQAPRRDRREPETGAGRAGGSRGAVRRVLTVPSMPQAMLASLTVITSIDILVAYLPAYGEAVGLSVATVGFLLSARAAASMVSRLLMLPLIRWLGRRQLLMWSMAVPAAALVAFTVFDHVALLFAAMIVIGFGLGLGQPVTLAWVAARAPAAVRGTAIGLRLSGNRLGQTALPALVGGIGGVLGLVAVFWALAVLLAASTATVWRAAFPEEADT
jgi:MFS family permease